MPYEMENVHMGNFADIRVIGVGGGGNNAINRMIESGLQGVRFVAVNSDAQDLSNSLSENKVQIGEKTTGGLGAGANPQVGQEAAEESVDDLQKIVEGADLIFVTAGMGGGTGTGAAHVIAKLAKDAGVLTVGVVTKPFSFEGKVRAQNAELGISLLREFVDALVVIPNEKLLTIADKNTTFKDALKMADGVLSQGVRGICDLIGTNGIINLDFSDVRTVIKDAGMAHMGIGYGTGEDKAIQAVNEAISSPLLDTSIKGATGVIMHITCGEDIGILEINSAAEVARELIDPDANLIFGAMLDPSMDDSIKITIIATGFNMQNKKEPAKIVVKNDEAGKAEQKAVEEKEVVSDDDWSIPDFLQDALKND